jgi:hypothetical protein
MAYRWCHRHQCDQRSVARRHEGAGLLTSDRAVIKKIVDVVSTFEVQLLNVLTETIAPERREEFAAQVAALASESSHEFRRNGSHINPGRQGRRGSGPVAGGLAASVARHLD